MAIQLSLTELEDLARREKDAEQRDRLRALVMGMQGFTSEETATRIGRSQRFVQKWLAIYQAGGIESVQQRKTPGAKSKLSQEEEMLFSGEMLEVLRTKGRVSGKTVVDVLRLKFGQDYSLQGAYELMRRLGLPIRQHRLARERLRHATPAPASNTGGKSAETPILRQPSQYGPGCKQDSMDCSIAPNLLSAILGSVEDSVLVVDLAGRVLLWNANYLKLWGIPSELIALRDNAKLLSHLLHKVRDPSAFLDHIHTLHATPAESSFDEVPLRDGRFIDRHSHPYTVAGRLVGRVWVFRDVTMRANAEIELRTRELRHSHVSAALANLVEHLETLNHGDSHAMPRAVAESLTQSLGVARAGVWLLSDEDTRLHCDDPYDARFSAYTEPTTWLASQCPHYFAAIVRKRDLMAHDARTHPATAEMASSYLTPLGIASLFDAPIFKGGRVVGVVRLEHVGASTRRFSSEDGLMVGMVAGMVSRYMGEASLRDLERMQAKTQASIRQDHVAART